MLTNDSTEFTVRLIGIDTPEAVAPDSPVECGGPQASASLATMARPGDPVQAYADPTQDDVDIYGRLLRYVHESGRDYGRAQIKAGWAKAYVYSAPFQRLRSYKSAARNARRADRGAWKRCGNRF